MSAKTKQKKGHGCDRFLTTWIDHDPVTGFLKGSGGCVFVSAPSLPEARYATIKQYPDRLPGVTLCGCCLPRFLEQIETLTAETHLESRQFYLVLRLAGIDHSKPHHENLPDFAASMPMVVPGADPDEALRYAREIALPSDLPYAILTADDLRHALAESAISGLSVRRG
jgi:hypothetical protein